MLQALLGRNLEDLIPEPMLVLSPKGSVLESNIAARRLFRLEGEGIPLESLLEKSDRSLSQTLELWLRKSSYTRGLVFLLGNDGRRYAAFGRRIHGDCESSPLILVYCEAKRATDKRFIELNNQIHSLRREILRRLETEKLLYEEKERLRVTLESIGDGVITADMDSNVTFLNPVAEEMTGWTLADAIGQPLERVFSIYGEKTGEAVVNPVAKVLRTGKVQGLANHTKLISQTGDEFSIEDTAAPIRDTSGNMFGVVLVFHDVTVARKLSAQISHQATHDGLTGLINREAFEEELYALLNVESLSDVPHALLYLDLDQFKVINDTSGHIAGDMLLRALGPVMKDHLRESDVLARLGGDEFAVLLKNCPPEAAGRIAETIRTVIREFRFIWDDKPYEIGVSIGQVNFTHGEFSVVELLSAADRSCYVAKDLGRNRIYEYGSDDPELNHRQNQIQWVSRITEAVDKDRFCLFFQTIVPVSQNGPDGSQCPDHFEILLRLRGADGSLVAPNVFIPAAERYDLMGKIDQWVLRKAFEVLSDKRLTSLKLCSINLSAASLGDRHFLPFVEALLDEHPVLPERLCFEITETAVISNLDNARRIIDSLRMRGCKFALDDFGSGMASFGYLKYLAVDYLKIDGLFVKDMVEDPVDRALVQAINSIGQVMGLYTIAEFVENDEIRKELSSIGVNYAQGFGISMPEPLENLLERLPVLA